MLREGEEMPSRHSWAPVRGLTQKFEHPWAPLPPIRAGIKPVLAKVVRDKPAPQRMELILPFIAPYPQRLLKTPLILYRFRCLAWVNKYSIALGLSPQYFYAAINPGVWGGGKSQKPVTLRLNC